MSGLIPITPNAGRSLKYHEGLLTETVRNVINAEGSLDQKVTTLTTQRLAQEASTIAKMLEAGHLEKQVKYYDAHVRLLKQALHQLESTKTAIEAEIRGALEEGEGGDKALVIAAKLHTLMHEGHKKKEKAAELQPQLSLLQHQARELKIELRKKPEKDEGLLRTEVEKLFEDHSGEDLKSAVADKLVSLLEQYQAKIDVISKLQEAVKAGTTDLINQQQQITALTEEKAKLQKVAVGGTILGIAIGAGIVYLATKN